MFKSGVDAINKCRESSEIPFLGRYREKATSDTSGNSFVYTQQLGYMEWG